MESDSAFGQRLTTQNLVLSAEAAIRTDRPAACSWSSVRDLATLIDLFCMNDGIGVLGTPLGSAFESPLGQLLFQSQFLRGETPTGHRDILNCARRHLFTFLEASPSSTFDDLLRDALNPAPSFFYSVESPDCADDFADGERWLKHAVTSANALDDLKKEPESARAVSLVVRSFLYIALSDLTGRPFVADVLRTGPTVRVAKAESDLRLHLVAAIAKGTHQRTLERQATLERVSPFASIVFSKAGTDRSGIVHEMDLLRFQLRHTRARLRDAEKTIFFGQGTEVAKAQNSWRATAQELQRTFGREPRLVSLQQIIGWGREAGDIADDPTKPKAWMQAILALPVEVIARHLNRRRAVELHRLQAQLPGEGAVRRSLKSLFGDLQG